MDHQAPGWHTRALAVLVVGSVNLSSEFQIVHMEFSSNRDCWTYFQAPLQEHANAIHRGHGRLIPCLLDGGRDGWQKVGEPVLKPPGDANEHQPCQQSGSIPKPPQGALLVAAVMAGGGVGQSSGCQYGIHEHQQWQAGRTCFRPQKGTSMGWYWGPQRHVLVYGDSAAGGREKMVVVTSGNSPNQAAGRL